MFRITHLLLLNAALVSAFQSLSPRPNVLSLKAEPSHDADIVAVKATQRREFLASAVASAVSGLFLIPPPAHAAKNPKVDYKAVAKDIEALIAEDPDKGPTFVRLAWHSSGTYDKMTNTGGSQGGTIRFQEELSHGGNAGLGVTAVPWLESIHAKYAKQGLSHADLYTLAGVASIKALGGPVIPWYSGRVDEPESSVTPDGRLPNAESGPKGADPSDAQHLRDIFYRMGFDDREIVALSGAHALGRCHPSASGYDGPWTPTPTTFNNAYFTLLSNLKWVPKEWDGPYQYVDATTGKLMMLPSDIVLLQDESFMNWVNVYASDAAKFTSDFSDAFEKLLLLGTKGLKKTEWA